MTIVGLPPKRVSIYDLRLFAGTLKMFRHPKLMFKRDALYVSESDSDKPPLTIRYRYSRWPKVPKVRTRC